MLFIASIFITLAAAYLYERCARVCTEVAIAAVAVTLIFLVLSLVIAPWPIQFLLLIALLVISPLHYGHSSGNS